MPEEINMANRFKYHTMYIYMYLNAAWYLFDMYNSLWGVYMFIWMCTCV